jgi:uncharacterized OB-fold protein
MIRTIGTYLPPWGKALSRQVGEDEDVVTMAVAAGLSALEPADASEVRSVHLVSRQLPLLEGGNSAALLAGLGLPATLSVQEQLGGAPAALMAAAAADAGTLVIAADADSGAGASAVLTGDHGAALDITGGIARSLPVTARGSTGPRWDYGDPRLLRERGLKESLRAVAVPKVSAVAGLRGKDATQMCMGDPPELPTVGASSAFFALAGLAGRGESADLVAVEQATLAAASFGSGPVAVVRDEPVPQPLPVTKPGSAANISISLAAYDRAFDAKLRLMAARCNRCGTLSYPHRLRCLGCGSEEPTEPVPLPREAEVYTVATIHVPVPGLSTPYTVVLAELGESGVRLLVRSTGVAPGSVAIGDRGRMVFRRVAVRSGIPDYGYAFLPNREGLAA